MNKKSLIIGIIVVIVVIAIGGLVFRGDLTKASPIKIIKFSDENSAITIISNSITKTATINMEIFYEEELLYPELFGERGDATEFITTIGCGVFSMAFFDPEALKEFTSTINEWNAMDGVVVDEEGKEIGEPEENPLEDYDITKFTLMIKEKETKKKVSQCIITGAEEEDIDLTYY